jgi:hypothetical protein
VSSPTPWRWPPPGRISTDDQFQLGIRIFIAGLQAQQPKPKLSA